MSNKRNVKALKIFMGDLSYQTIALSNEGFPINIGYISAYSIERFKSRIDVTLFKYIEEIEQRIINDPPDVLGLSNYAWNNKIGIEIFKLALKNNPNVITVCGGVNFPLDTPSQKKFMQNNPMIDVYVPLEGEIGFSNLIDNILKINNDKQAKQIIRTSKIEGCITRDIKNDIQYGLSLNRIKKLDDIPSPYLTGLMDKFFDGKLSPMIQTNRGCPFACTFCVDGSDKVMKVNSFSNERIDEELEYIGKHVPKSTNSMIISDLNFGMFPKDLEVCNSIAKIQKKYNFPTEIQATTGKNSKEKIIKAIKKLNGALRLWLSVQSLDKQVLKNVKRENISVNQIMELNTTIKEANLRTRSEIILGLPSETYQSHVNSLKELIHAKIEHIDSYTLMLVDGSELATPLERSKWGFQTKYRVIPRDFVKLKSGKNIVEIEEVVISSNTLSFDEYLKLRLLAFSIYVTNIGIVYEPLLKFLREKNIDTFELFYHIVSDIQHAPKIVKNVFDRFKESTKNELWDSPQEITQYYQNEDNYKKLLNGEVGINVMQFYNAVITSDCMPNLTQYLINISYNLLKNEDKLTPTVTKQLDNIRNYCTNLSYNVLGKDRLDTNPISEFDYDFINWLNEDMPIENFELELPLKLNFELDKKQYDLVESKLKIFGVSDTGLAQVIKRTPIELLWRKPIIVRTAQVFPSYWFMGRSKIESIILPVYTNN